MRLVSEENNEVVEVLFLPLYQWESTLSDWRTEAPMTD